MEESHPSPNSLTRPLQKNALPAHVGSKHTLRELDKPIDGKFSIAVPSNQGTLVISYTGYATQEIEVSSSNPNVDVLLATSAELLSEVVVTGYGQVRKEALTGSVTTLNAEKLESPAFASVEQVLQGNVAGLQANMGNGQPGANVQIRIRNRTPHIVNKYIVFWQNYVYFFC